MSDWIELKTLQEVAQAQEDDLEIEVLTSTTKWYKWNGGTWQSYWKFRARPKQPKMKQVVLREALLCGVCGYEVRLLGRGADIHKFGNFICWLDTPERIVEVPEND